MILQGTWVAAVTPFRQGKIDLDAYRNLIRHMVAGGVDGLVPCGTTGEASVLTHQEYVHIVEVAVEEAGGQLPVFAGTGSNSTAKTIETTRLAKEIGCTGALVVTPYYNKPTQDGLYAHYREIALEVPDFPIFLYNVPSRTSVNMLPETTAKLSEIDTVVGIKEASGSVAQILETISQVEGRVAVFSGDDIMNLALYAMGGTGTISVAANVDPARTAAVWQEFQRGNLAEAQRLQLELLPLIHALFIETNPAPAKAALSMMGLCDNELRLPLVPVTDKSMAKIRHVLDELGIIAA
ncbi:MAG: 4-hydroxy-tetrahydrodipicolinate synthase [Myxococcales bacterium]|nr:4-hydroxy-tetrahydrodipicolinate synthase [Myxococcales bacterium]